MPCLFSNVSHVGASQLGTPAAPTPGPCSTHRKHKGPSEQGSYFLSKSPSENGKVSACDATGWPK